MCGVTRRNMRPPSNGQEQTCGSPNCIAAVTAEDDSSMLYIIAFYVASWTNCSGKDQAQPAMPSMHRQLLMLYLKHTNFEQLRPVIG
jgi:hypothetical protein